MKEGITEQRILMDILICAQDEHGLKCTYSETGSPATDYKAIQKNLKEIHLNSFNIQNSQVHLFQTTKGKQVHMQVSHKDGSPLEATITKGGGLNLLEIR